MQEIRPVNLGNICLRYERLKAAIGITHFYIC